MRPRFQELQYQFTAHMRDPALNPGPEGVEPRRLKVYAELLYNNVQSFLASSFPVLRSLVADDDWHRLVRDYFKSHQARTPLFPKMPQEFLHYLTEQRSTDDDLPFMAELAFYEWLELEALLDERDLADVEVEPGENLLDGVPVLNPIARANAFEYPVHAIGPDNVPTEPGSVPTYLVVYRNRDHDVGFMQLNPVTARLIELLGAPDLDRCGRELLQQIAGEMQHPDPALVIAGGASIMDELLERHVLLGARKRSQ